VWPETILLSVVLVVELVKVKPSFHIVWQKDNESDTEPTNHGFNGFMDDLHEEADRALEWSRLANHSSNNPLTCISFSLCQLACHLIGGLSPHTLK
jgi:hypothetical protein